jgi:hypothetical protein
MRIELVLAKSNGRAVSRREKAADIGYLSILNIALLEPGDPKTQGQILVDSIIL